MIKENTASLVCSKQIKGSLTDYVMSQKLIRPIDKESAAIAAAATADPDAQPLNAKLLTKLRPVDLQFGLIKKVVIYF